jgi:hypothetical protein
MAAFVAATLLNMGNAHAQYTWNWTNLSNPNLDIAVTDFGYSDGLLDHEPGFEGHE